MVGFAFSGQNGKMATAFNAIGGIGFSAPLILLLTMAQLSTPPLFIGVVSALTISVRTLGGTIGYAIAEGKLIICLGQLDSYFLSANLYPPPFSHLRFQD